MFENDRKKFYLTLRAKRATFNFEWTKIHQNCHKMVHFGEFLKAYGQKVLPDISLFAGQKLMENAKKKVIFSNYQTMLKIFLKYKTT